jgi:ribonuclease VapC
VGRALGEPDAEVYAAPLQRPVDELVRSVVSDVEARIALVARLGNEAVEKLDTLSGALAIRVAPCDGAQTAAAHRAWLRFGRGRHPAPLNLGDCFSHALAATRHDELLVEGRDFAPTDITAVLKHLHWVPTGGRHAVAGGRRGEHETAARRHSLSSAG